MINAGTRHTAGAATEIRRPTCRSTRQTATPFYNIDKRMITIVARNIVKEGKRAEFLEAIRPLIEASRAEPGNIAYDLYEDTADCCAFCFIERWKDEAAVAAHNESAHFRTWMAVKAEYVASGKVTRYRPV